MGRRDSDRTISGIFRDVPNTGDKGWQWNPEKRVLWIDIAIREVADLEWVHDQMLRRAPCIALVRVHQTIWTYYTGAAVDDKYMLVTCGKLCYDLQSISLGLDCPTIHQDVSHKS